MRDFGFQRGFGTDHRALKALLLNGATKDAVRDHNGLWIADGLQAQNKNGSPIYIGWDSDLGTGLLNVGQSLQNYNPGEMNPGNVGLIGWDLQAVNPNSNNAYTFTTPAQGILEIRATLAWDRFLSLNDGDADNLWDVGETFTASTLNDLDLEIWDLTLNQRVFFSTSDMDSIEHVDFVMAEADNMHNFELRVNFFNDFALRGAETYGLAWTVVPFPEPATLTLLGLGALIVLRRSRKAL